MYVEKPDIDAAELAFLRKAVGWDERLDKIRRSAGSCYLRIGCFSAGRLVGFVEVISDFVDDAYIRNLIVHPDFQRQGIGLRLLQMVAARARADGIKTMNVLFEPALTGFYAKAGFTIMCGGLIDNERVSGDQTE
ncbi:MAG: GNAT family N-acetyltransferase [Bacillota bacterium]